MPDPVDPRFIANPLAYAIGKSLAGTHDSGKFAHAALSAPNDMSDVDDRTIPQSTSQLLQNQWFDAQVKYRSLVQELKNQLQASH